MIKMERGQCIVPIELPNGEYAGTKKKESWSEIIRADNEAMTLSDPEYAPPSAVGVASVQTMTNEATQCIDMRDYMNGIFDNGLEDYRPRPLISTLGCNHMVSINDDVEVESAYKIQKGKNQANSEDALAKEKKKVHA